MIFRVNEVSNIFSGSNIEQGRWLQGRRHLPGRFVTRQTVQLHHVKKIPRWNGKLVYANKFFYPGI